MIKHVVSFKLRGSAEERFSAASEFSEAIKALPSVIDCLIDVETGVNTNPDEDWDVALVCTLRTLEDVAVYAKHPAHVAAAAIIAPFKESRSCVDFEV